MSEAPKIDRPFLDFRTHIRDVVSSGLRKAPAHSSFASTEPDPPPIPARDKDAFEILRVVAQAYVLRVDDLTGRDRHKAIAEARLVAYWLLRSRTRMSFPEIGRVMGDKDHTTIMAGVKSFDLRQRLEPSFAAFAEKLAAAVDARLKEEA